MISASNFMFFPYFTATSITMRTYLPFIVCSLLISLCCRAQVRISANLTGTHQALIQHAKHGKRLYDFIKQQRQDSIGIIKADTSLSGKEKRKKIKALKHRYKAEKKAAKRMAKEQVEKETGVILPDTILYPPKTGEDSLKWALQTLASEGQSEKIRQVYEAYAAVDSLSTDSLGYAAAQQAEKIAASFLPQEVNSMKTQAKLPEPDQLFLDQLPASELPHENLGELLEEASEANIGDALNSLSDLKSRYSEMPDIRFPEKAVRKNSLKGKGVRKRLVLGGNIALQSTDPVVMDVDLQLGYRITKKWSAGAGVIWRETLGKVDSLSRTKVESAHGYSVFANYTIYHNFFLYGEFSRLKDQPLFNRAGSEITGSWQEQWLAGIGNEFSLFKFINLSMILAYDFNHRNNNLHSRPFVFKMGYRISQLPFGRKK